MVVDLQGVLKINNDGTKCYELTDPVIHKRRKKSKNKLRKYTFGRTVSLSIHISILALWFHYSSYKVSNFNRSEKDRGDKGMKAFFKTHKCSELCRLLGLKRNIDASYQEEKSPYVDFYF